MERIRSFDSPPKRTPENHLSRLYQDSEIATAYWVRVSGLGPGIVCTHEFICSSFCNKSRSVALLNTWSTATCTARHNDRTEQSTDLVQIATCPEWLSQKPLSNSRPPRRSTTSPMTICSAGRASV